MKGFTIVELLVAMAIVLVVGAGAVSMMGSAHDAFQVQPETADLQQRARAGIDALHKDLLMAGAGMYAAGAVGPLHRAIAPVMPYRAFGSASDAARNTYFTRDAISLLFVPSTHSQTTLAAPLNAGTLGISIDNPPTCPVAGTGHACGFADGDQLLLFNRTSEWDVFTIDRVASATELSLSGSPPGRPFDIRTNVTEVNAVTYALKADPASGAFQLVRAEGAGSAQPVLDQVVKLEFQYFGDPQPPRVIDETETRVRTSYGPAPPSLDEPLAGWPAGENCVFTFVDGQHPSRLAALGAAGSLIEITPSMLTDGPWCPDASARTRFDADLLRIRRIRFALRVQTPLRILRGPAGRLFANGGLARAGGRSVPDLEIQLDVTPRNLNLDISTVEP